MGTPIILMVLAFGGFDTVIAAVIVCFAAGIGAHGVIARRRKKKNADYV